MQVERLFLIANCLDFAAQIALMVMATLAARRWGGQATRIAAVVNVIAFALTTPAGLLPLPDAERMVTVCSLDLLTAAGFLYAAARYNSLWISVSVLAQGIQAAIDMIYVEQGASFDRLHHFMIGAAANAFTYAIQAGILGAALTDRRRRPLTRGDLSTLGPSRFMRAEGCGWNRSS